MSELEHPAKPESNRLRWLICLALACVTLLVFGRVIGFDFLCYDDPDYVTLNLHVIPGLTLDGAVWAFSAFHSGNWHPLTWLSHMLDVQIFGLRPGAHHAINVLFHAANAVLLFLVLLRMTRAQWRSALVAAFFAWHPLHVESVAWVAERKDVLSTFFWLLTMGAYTRYVEKPGTARYLLALLLFALGLMAKPMLVTLPFVLLLLDFWPLGRTFIWHPQATGATPPTTQPGKPVNLAKLCLEKLPFLGLTAVSCWITMRAQVDSMTSKELLPFDVRLYNALVCYLKYLGKIIWPVDLAIFYPHPVEVPGEIAAVALLILATLTVAAIIRATRFPYLAFGWLWYLGTLVPVIGLVQVGEQELADRYTYIPSIGLFIAVVWGVAECLKGHKRWRTAAGFATVSSLAACVTLTYRQVGYWRNDQTVFSHARDVTVGNYVAYSVLASKLQFAGKLDDAISEYNNALAIRPGSVEALYGLGGALLEAGRVNEAIDKYHEALRVQPHYVGIHNALGVALANQLNYPESEAECREELKLDPGNLAAHVNLAWALFNQKKLDPAIVEFGVVLAALPDSIDNLLGLGNALALEGKLDQAAAQYTHVLRLQPDNAEAHRKLGTVLAFQGRLDEAVRHYLAALGSDPKDPSTHYQLGSIYNQRGQTEQAIKQYEAALLLRPDYPETLNNLAWIRAASASPQFRDGKEAVRLAEHACELTGNANPLFLGTLAAAYAEAGRLSDAAGKAAKARDLAQAMNLKPLAARNQELLQLYQAGKPYHEGDAPPAGPPR